MHKTNKSAASSSNKQGLKITKYKEAIDHIKNTCHDVGRSWLSKYAFIPFPLCLNEDQLFCIPSEFKYYRIRYKPAAMVAIWEFSGGIIDSNQLPRKAYSFEDPKLKKDIQTPGFEPVSNPISYFEPKLMTLLGNCCGDAQFISSLTAWNKFALTAAFFCFTCNMNHEMVAAALNLQNDEEIHNILAKDEYWQGKLPAKPFYPIYTTPTHPIWYHYNLLGEYTEKDESGAQISVKGIDKESGEQLFDKLTAFCEAMKAMNVSNKWTIAEILGMIHHIFNPQSAQTPFIFGKHTKRN